MPNIDVRVNSQDLIQMNKEQIAALFKGLALLASKSKTPEKPEEAKPTTRSETGKHGP